MQPRDDALHVGGDLRGTRAVQLYAVQFSGTGGEWQTVWLDGSASVAQTHGLSVLAGGTAGGTPGQASRRRYLDWLHPHLHEQALRLIHGEHAGLEGHAWRHVRVAQHLGRGRGEGWRQGKGAYGALGTSDHEAPMLHHIPLDPPPAGPPRSASQSRWPARPSGGTCEQVEGGIARAVNKLSASHGHCCCC